MSIIGQITPLSMASRAYATTKTMGADDASAASSVQGSGFGSMVSNAAHSALQTLRGSEKTSMLGVAGKADVQDVVQAAANAEVTVKSVVAVLGKAMNAYNDVMKMSV